MALTDKQRRFVDEYLVDLNATQAAIRSGYSAKTARWIGPKLVTKSHIAVEIARKQEKLAKRVELTQDMVIEGLLGEAKLIGEGSSHSARVSAWNLLGKHQGMFSDKLQLTGANGGPIQFAKVTVRGVRRD